MDIGEWLVESGKRGMESVESGDWRLVSGDK